MCSPTTFPGFPLPRSRSRSASSTRSSWPAEGWWRWRSARSWPPADTQSPGSPWGSSSSGRWPRCCSCRRPAECRPPRGRPSPSGPWPLRSPRILGPGGGTARGPRSAGPAERPNRAAAAERADGPAEVLAVLDQERVQGDPEPPIEDLPQPGLGLLWTGGEYNPEPVRDAVDVGVDRHPGDPVAEDQDAVRRLGADPGEGGELGQGSGNPAREPFEDLPGDPGEKTGLGPVEPGRPDQRLDLVGGGPGE